MYASSVIVPPIVGDTNLIIQKILYLVNVFNLQGKLLNKKYKKSQNKFNHISKDENNETIH